MHDARSRGYFQTRHRDHTEDAERTRRKGVGARQAAPMPALPPALPLATHPPHPRCRGFSQTPSAWPLAPPPSPNPHIDYHASRVLFRDIILVIIVPTPPHSQCTVIPPSRLSRQIFPRIRRFSQDVRSHSCVRTPPGVECVSSERWDCCSPETDADHRIRVPGVAVKPMPPPGRSRVG